MTDAPTTRDAVELAMEAEAGSSPAPEALTLIRNQNRLVLWQIAAERAGLALRVLLGLAGLALAAALGVMVWTAAHADGVVLRPFSVAPQLAAQGVSGEVLTAEFLDHINVQQVAALGTAMQRSGTIGGAGEELRLEIPQTGVSLGELDRALRAWLGHERIITGAMTQAGDTITLTVRLAGEPPVTASGPAGDRQAVVRAAAEQIFARADPLRALFYLRQTGREEEAQALLRQVRSVGKPGERADGFSFSATNASDAHQALAYARQAIAIDPTYPMAYMEMFTALQDLGRWEAARAYNSMARERMRPRRDLIFGPGSLVRLQRNIRLREAQFAGDHARAFQVAQETATAIAAQRRVVGAPVGDPEPNLAGLAAQAHDLDLAYTLLERARLRGVAGPALLAAQARVDAAAGRWAAADAGFSEALATSGQLRGRLRLTYEAARAKAMAGDLAGAQALIAPTPLDCYPCLIVRGQVAARAGQPAEADRWFDAAVKAGPSLPHAEAAWAEALLARGDFGNALSWAQAAHRKGPRFADPLAFAGEAQLALGGRKAAAASLRQAIALAPAWDRPRAALAKAQQ